MVKYLPVKSTVEPGAGTAVPGTTMVGALAEGSAGGPGGVAVGNGVSAATAGVGVASFTDTGTTVPATGTGVAAELRQPETAAASSSIRMAVPGRYCRRA